MLLTQGETPSACQCCLSLAFRFHGLTSPIHPALRRYPCLAHPASCANAKREPGPVSRYTRTSSPSCYKRCVLTLARREPCSSGSPEVLAAPNSMVTRHSPSPVGERLLSAQGTSPLYCGRLYAGGCACSCQWCWFGDVLRTQTTLSSLAWLPSLRIMAQAAFSAYVGRLPVPV